MLELIHAWSGELHAGGPGFGTVHQTRGISERTARTLAMGSGMDLLRAGPAQPVFAHRIMILDGAPQSVLTRITQTDGPADDRPGRIAHHLVLTPSERPKIGPVALLVSEWFRSSWNDADKPTAVPPSLPTHCELPSCSGVDPEWLHLLARRAQNHAPMSILVPPPTPCIDLMAAIEQSLPTEQRWELTFLTDSSHNTDGILVRAARAGTKMAGQISAEPDSVVLSLKESPSTQDEQEPAADAEHAAVDRVELAPAALELEPTRSSGPLIVILVLCAVASVAIAIAAIGGWLA